jgi:hypothetical protein
VPETEAEREAICEQLERVLASPLFKNSKRYPSLLRYVVKHALEDRDAHLKERTLGVEVLGRHPDYDTNLDPVVRTTAGEIRKRIAQYYHEPGHQGEIRIDLPLGSYVPEFRMPAAVAVPVVPARRKWPVWAVVAPAAIAMILAAVLWIAPWGYPTALDRFWGPVLDSSNPVVLCVSPALGSLSRGEQGGSESIRTFDELERAEAHHVALADAITLSRLAGLLQLKKKTFHIRNGAFTTFTDLREGPVVLIGAFNNPWTLRLTGHLRFSFEKDLATQTGWIRDRQNPAQSWSVSMTAPYLQLTEDYAIVARLLDPTTEKMMVVAAGIGKFGTEAAGEFLTDPAYLESLVRQAPRGWGRKNVEAVIATKLIGGNSGPPRVLAAYFW